jgi:predicted Zn-dependent peptidase
MVRRRVLTWLAAVLLVLTASAAEAFDLASQVREFTLQNGMRWLVVTRKNAPVFSGVVMVRVGGGDESPGKTGLAHMFEHMAFKGSSRIGTRDWKHEEPVLREIEQTGAELTAASLAEKKDDAAIAALAKKMEELRREADRFQAKNEVWEVLKRNGAHDLNAYTSKDLTAFYASMPSSRLSLWANVMAEMILRPAYREFYTERSVVVEERRTSVENDPEGALGDRILSTAYKGGPYSFATIGHAKDVQGLTVGDARAFHDRFYVASNMVGVIVGDATVEQVRRVAEQAFGALPTKPRPTEPAEKGEERTDVEEKLPFDAAPSLAMVFHKPTLPALEEYGFDVVESLLCDGRASRLEKGLVYERRLAKSVYCSDGYPGSRFRNLFVIWVEPLKGRSLASVRAAIDVELARLGREAVGEEELARARKQVTASIVYGLDSNDDLAEALARFQTDFGDWRLLAAYPARIAAVDAAAIQALAERYLVEQNRIVVERVKGHR